jgi:pyruvate dehydrogenase E1 component
MNENYAHPSMPSGVEDAIVRGMYKLASHARDGEPAQLRLLGSGTILREVIAAAALLAEDFGVRADVFSVTSFSELARDAREVERWNRLNPDAAPRSSHVGALLPGGVPIVAATDYVRAYPGLIAAHVDAPFTALGTDGFGRSDTRAALRRFFEVDRQHIVVAALAVLADRGVVARRTVAAALESYGIEAAPVPPWRA